MAELANDLLLRALLCEKVERTPVWIMRQAGRYLPEYRELREQAGDFMSLCSNPDLACEVTLQPLRRFKLDAAILFSDILTVPNAMGLGLYFEAGEGPRFERPVRSPSDIKNLRQPDVEKDLGYVFEAVRTIRRELNGSVPLIGFAGSPWTVATYMVEGRSSRDFATIKRLATEDPAALSSLLDIVAQTTIDYLNAQVAAGAQAIMLLTLGERRLRRMTIGGIRSQACRKLSTDSRARAMGERCRSSCSRKVPDRCCPSWPIQAATPWAWIGQLILQRHASTLLTRWRYRETSTRQRCESRRPKSGKALPTYSKATVPALDMSSTWATA